MDANTGYIGIIGLSVIANIVYNFLKDRNNGKVFEVLLRVKTMGEKQEVMINCLDALKTESIKQTSLLEQLVKRDS